MSRPTLEVADVVRQYGAASLARYGSTVSPEQHRQGMRQGRRECAGVDGAAAARSLTGKASGRDAPGTAPWAGQQAARAVATRARGPPAPWVPPDVDRQALGHDGGAFASRAQAAREHPRPGLTSRPLAVAGPGGMRPCEEHRVHHGRVPFLGRQAIPPERTDVASRSFFSYTAKERAAMFSRDGDRHRLAVA